MEIIIVIHCINKLNVNNKTKQNTLSSYEMLRKVLIKIQHAFILKVFEKSGIQGP